MKPQRQEMPAPNGGTDWRNELNAAEDMAGRLRERLRSLKASAESEADNNADAQSADWWRMAAERLDNGAVEADQISSALAVLDEGP